MPELTCFYVDVGIHANMIRNQRNVNLGSPEVIEHETDVRIGKGVGGNLCIAKYLPRESGPQ